MRSFRAILLLVAASFVFSSVDVVAADYWYRQEEVTNLPRYEDENTHDTVVPATVPLRRDKKDLKGSEQWTLPFKLEQGRKETRFYRRWIRVPELDCPLSYKNNAWVGIDGPGANGKLARMLDVSEEVANEIRSNGLFASAPTTWSNFLEQVAATDRLLHLNLGEKLLVYKPEQVMRRTGYLGESCRVRRTEVSTVILVKESTTTKLDPKEVTVKVQLTGGPLLAGEVEIINVTYNGKTASAELVQGPVKYNIQPSPETHGEILLTLTGTRLRPNPGNQLDITMHVVRNKNDREHGYLAFNITNKLYDADVKHDVAMNILVKKYRGRFSSYERLRTEWITVAGKSSSWTSGVTVKPGEELFVEYWMQVRNSTYYSDAVSNGIETKWFKVPAQNAWE